MDLRKTAIRVDFDAAQEAAAILGTATLTDTVNAALREIADRERRAALLDHLAGGEGFDFGVIDDAWR